jgi:hypothetical protein
VTSFVRNTGTSAACGGAPYAYLPNPANTSGMRISSAYVGTRVLATYSGSIVNCNTITGNVTGPASGLPQLNGHVIGCTLADGSQCPANVATAVDTQASNTSQRVVGGSFSMVRVANTVTCANVRAMTFP